MNRLPLNKSLAVGLCSLMLLACSSMPKQPQWIDRPDADYPANNYLSATGAADDRQTAADRAVSNLAKTFEVEVQESTMDFSSATLTNDAGQSQISNEQTLTRRVSTEARQVLEGAKVVEYWKSEQGRTYALAVLQKQAATSRFRQAIQADDREVADLIGFASNTANNPLIALSALNKARVTQQQRDQLNKNLMVVANGNGIKSPYDTAAVETLIRDALATLTVVAQAEDASIKAELQRALSLLGIQSVTESNFVLHGAMDLAPVEQRQGWFWVRGSYELYFKDGESVLAKQRWPVKVSATEAPIAQQRARDEMNQQLHLYVFELLSSSKQ